MSDKNTSEMIASLKKALSKMENGKIYSSKSVALRLSKVAEKNPTDALVCNMRDIVLKKSASSDFISQKEIGALYDSLLGLQKNSVFRSELEDLLPESRQFRKIERKAFSIRTDTENDPIITDYENSKLKEVFAKFFNFEKEEKIERFKSAENTPVKKVTVSALASIGYIPESVKIAKENGHFTLVNASFRRKDGTVNILMPIQTSGGLAVPPTKFIQDGNLVSLNKENLFVAIKNAENSRKVSQQNKFASYRADYGLKTKQYEVPSELSGFANLENELMAATSKFSQSKVLAATRLVHDELKGLGLRVASVSVGNSSDKELVFDVRLHTQAGKALINVPVEFVNGNMTMPSRFAGAGESGLVYDFSKKGFDSFLSGLTKLSNTIRVERETGSFTKMSYNELVEQIIKGVFDKDYKKSEDALYVIQAKFGPEHHRTALNKFTNLLKASSSLSGTDRAKNVEAAIKRGDLIKHATTVEWYCPKLGLPLSKVAFDEKGRVIPARKSAQSENQNNGVVINTSRIYLT